MDPMIPSIVLALSLAPLPLSEGPQTPPAPPGIQQFLHARGLQNQRKFSQALGAYRQMETTWGSSPELLLRLAECAKEVGDLKYAWDKIEKARELAPQQQEIAIQWGLIAHIRALRDKTFIPTARKVLHKATQQVPQEIELWGRRAELAEVEKDAEEALEGWLNVVGLREDFIPAWERIMVLTQQLNRYEPRRQAAIYLAKKVGDKQSLSALEGLANEQLKKGYIIHAEESYTLLAQALASEADAWEVLGVVQLELKKYAQALESFQSALALRPSHRIRFSTAQVKMLLRRNEDAQEDLRALWDEIKEDQQNPLRKKTKALLITNLFLMKRYNSLLELARVNSTPQDADAFLKVHLFMARVALEDWSEARKQLGNLFSLQGSELGLNLKELLGASFDPRASTTRPPVLRAIALRCQAELHLPYLGESETLALLHTPEVKDLSLAMSTLILESSCWNNLGNTEASIKVLRQAHELDPTQPLILNNLGYALLESQSTLSEATELLEEAYRLQPEDKNILDSIGWLRFKQGRYADAAPLLRKAQTLNPESFEVHVHLFECLNALGQEEEALVFLDIALALRRQEESALLKRRDELRRQLNLKKLQSVSASSL